MIHFQSKNTLDSQETNIEALYYDRLKNVRKSPRLVTLLIIKLEHFT